MSEITLLDGSIGQEIVKRSGSRATPLWSTAVMMEQPEVVRAVHLEYFNAGATIATANTYAVHVDRLARVGLEEQHKTLLDTAMAEALAARAAHGSGRIAVALGPLGASYRPDLAPPLEEARAAFATIVAALSPLADLFIIETVSSLHDARGALMGCAETDKPVWLSVTVDDDDGTKLRSGESVSDLAQILQEFAPAALLVNCSRPEAISAALDLIAPLGLPFGAYANGFTRISEGFLKDAPTVDALEQRQDLGPEAYAKFALHWVAQGATIVGGCCEVGPGHIKELATQLKAAGHTIV
ncbi:homocysteine S-methyltransferase family protein [uncultured Lentibacter sp.]|uniref:homocysteine S-methyltransferase family protein n=1 Tax=uncultured Lentibacter sp. TaxID=1659309 RepID=UPI002603BBB8|nr:homocysteine S-methyltransferase family protein [uncultured Lentibacter sp.]